MTFTPAMRKALEAVISNVVHWNAFIGINGTNSNSMQTLLSLGLIAPYRTGNLTKYRLTDAVRRVLEEK